MASVRLTDAQRKAARELFRRRKDPLSLYRPSGPQEACFRSEALYRAITGVNRGGKTFHAMIEAAHMLRGTHPYRQNGRGLSGVVAVPSRKQASLTQGKYLLKKSGMKGDYLPDYIRDIPLLRPDEVDVSWDRASTPHCPRLITHKKTRNELHVILSASGRPDELLQGMSFDFAFIDETAGSQAFIDELFPRLLDNDGWLLWTVTQTKVNMAMESYLSRCRDPEQKDYAVFIAGEGDNPAVSRESRDRMADALSKSAADIRMRGTSSALGEVLIFPPIELNPKMYIRDEPYVPQLYDNIIVSYDPGVDHPTGLLFAYLTRDEQHRVRPFHFICQSQMSVSTEAEMVLQVLNGRKIAMFSYDPHGATRRDKGTGKSAMQLLADHLSDRSIWAEGRPVWVRPKGGHRDGIAAVREFLEPHVKRSPVPLIEIDKPTVENGLHTFIAQLRAYRGREDLEFTGPSGVVKKNDEGPDCLRYMVMANPCWRDFGPNMEMGYSAPIFKPNLETTERNPTDAKTKKSANIARQWRSRHRRRPTRRRTLFG